ncbi:MAG TPA: MotA/TolQ/ExbB proton channel family protein [Polyangiaceae bacterium]|nr:MotA/TolQ/ExbB proton channel family protein [Polyangiaceae bacterium]
MGFNLVEIWHTMGSLSKLVAISLVAMAVLVLGVVIERSFAMARGTAQSRAFAKEAAPAIDRGDWQAVVDLAKNYAHSPLARLLGGGARHYLSFVEAQDGTRVSYRSAPPHEKGAGLDPVEATRRELARGAETVGAELRTGMGMLASIGSITPFVGLFGTVVGIITAFQGIAKSGSSGLGAVSAGIAEALVMTAFGLLVAIPAVLLFNYLNGKIDGVERKLTTATGEFLDNLEHYHGSDSGVHERRAA